MNNGSLIKGWLHNFLRVRSGLGIFFWIRIRNPDFLPKFDLELPFVSLSGSGNHQLICKLYSRKTIFFP